MSASVFARVREVYQELLAKRGPVDDGNGRCERMTAPTLAGLKKTLD